MSDDKIDAESLQTELESHFDKLLRKQVVIGELDDLAADPENEESIAAVRARFAKAALEVFTRPH